MNQEMKTVPMGFPNVSLGYLMTCLQYLGRLFYFLLGNRFFDNTYNKVSFVNREQ